MIVTTDFFEHWKTRLLIKITKDKASPLCVQRGWAHCQQSKRWRFSGMTPDQLASICHWDDMNTACKITCHAALIKAGFVKRIPGGGFEFHQWNEHNAKLIANWENGNLGGRPPTNKIPNENGQSEKPVGFGGLTQPEPIDQTRLIRPDLKEKKEGTDQIAGPSVLVHPPKSDGVGSVALGEKRKSDQRTLENVRAWIGECFSKESEHTIAIIADNYFEAFDKLYDWRDEKGEPIKSWKPHSKAYCAQHLTALKNPKRR